MKPSRSSIVQNSIQASTVYAEVIWLGRNTSGIQPYGRNVLVKMDEVRDVSKGGIIWPDGVTDKTTAQTTTGCIFAMGPVAFRRFDDGAKWEGPRPEVGDRVIIVKYSGEIQEGRDGGFYRLMDTGCVVGGIDKDYVEEETGDVG